MDLPGDHFDYDNAKFSIAILVKHYNRSILEAIDLDRQIDALKVEIKRGEAAQDDLLSSIRKLGFEPEPADGGLIHTCKETVDAER